MRAFRKFEGQTELNDTNKVLNHDREILLTRTLKLEKYC